MQKKFGLRGLCPHGDNGTTEFVPWSQWNGRACLRPHGVIGTAEVVSVPMESMVQPSLSPSPWSQWNGRVCLRPHGVIGTAEFVSVPMESMEQPSLSPRSQCNRRFRILELTTQISPRNRNHILTWGCFTLKPVRISCLGGFASFPGCQSPEQVWVHPLRIKDLLLVLH